MIIELAICSDPLPPPCWSRVSALILNNRLILMMTDLCGCPPLPSMIKTWVYILEIRVRWVAVQIKQVMGINYLKINWVESNLTGFLKLFWKSRIWFTRHSRIIGESAVFKIDRLTWQKHFALFCKTISEIFINGYPHRWAADARVRCVRW